MIGIQGGGMSLATFPGIVVHEMSHRFFCDLAGVKVFDVCYFSTGDPAGYVLHEGTPGIRANLLISIGPLIINTLLCMLLTLPFSFPAFVLNAESIPFSSYLLAWAGFSIGVHAFPSNQDMDNFLAAVANSEDNSGLFVIALPFALLLKLANILSAMWFDVIYAVLVAAVVPFYIFHLL